MSHRRWLLWGICAAAGCAGPAPAPADAVVRLLADAAAPRPVTSAPSPAGPVGAPAFARPAFAHHVIIVSEDGLRPDAIARARAPAHRRIMKEGAWSLRARTIRQASTLAAHASMLSGFDVGAHGLHWNSWRPERGFIKVPTIFSAATGAGQTAAAFVGKRKLEHITRPAALAIFARPGYFCAKVVERAAAWFVERRPAVQFVHFSDPDERGHSVGWMSDAQIDAISTSDRCLARLIEAVETAGMLGDTLFILSADHGGHGRNHSGSREEDRLIPWLAFGAGVRRGHQIRGAVTTMDTAATALWALGYETPVGLVGRPVKEAFDDPPVRRN